MVVFFYFGCNYLVCNLQPTKNSYNNIYRVSIYIIGSIEHNLVIIIIKLACPSETVTPLHLSGMATLHVFYLPLYPSQ